MALTFLESINELLSRFGLKEVSSLGQTSDATIAARKLNLAQQMICTYHPFTWMEKTTPGSFTAVDGTATYNLADDVAHLLAAKHEYNGGAPLKVVDRKTLEDLRAKRSDSSQRNVPTHICAAGSYHVDATVAPQLIAELWPVPDANFAGQAITYPYTYIPASLSTANHYSIIPPDYHWLWVDVAETLFRTGPIRVGGDQNQVDLFALVQERAKAGLRALVSRDSQLGAQSMVWASEDPGL